MSYAERVRKKALTTFLTNFKNKKQLMYSSINLLIHLFPHIAGKFQTGFIHKFWEKTEKHLEKCL